MVDDASFIDQFHGLTGKLLSERKKNLFILLEKYRSIGNNENILEKISSNLHPKTYLEETYRVEFLLYFKRVESLFEIVEDGNVKLANKIIKQKWFLIEIMKDIRSRKSYLWQSKRPLTIGRSVIDSVIKDMSPHQVFVEYILPKLSLVMRLKILKQILKHFKDEKFMDDLFQQLLRTYGFRTALVVISGCSLRIIKEFLTRRGLKMSMAQIKLLHDKDKSLIRFYYEEYHKRGGNMASLNSFTCYLSKKDPSLFMELRMKYDFPSNFRLGRRSTRCYIEDNKESITEDPLKYLVLKAFKESVFVRKLGSEFPGILKVMFPESYSDHLKMSQVFDLLENYPKKMRYALFSNIFGEVYNMDLIRAKEVMTLEFLETIPSHEEREKWVKVFNNEVEYIQFKRSTLAIPELKELLFRADNATSRMELFEYIINTCSISQDYDSFLDILKLIQERYRNDDAIVSVVLRKMKEKMDLCKLTEEHWKYINEIITMRELNNLSLDGEVIMEYSKFLYKSGKSFEELIPKLIKSGLVDIPIWRFVDAEFRDEKFQKLFLKAILKCYPNMDKEFKTSWSTVSLVTVIKRWNQKHPHDLIIVSHEKSIIEIIQELTRQWIFRDGHQMNSLKYLICGENNAEDFEDIYFYNINILSNVTITRWFLKYKPKVFLKHIDKIQPCFSGNGKNLTTILKKLEYLGVVKAILNHYSCSYSDILSEATPERVQKKLIAQFLASVMPTDNYLVLLEKFTPEVEKLNLSKASEEDKKKLQIGKSLAQSVRFSSCHTAALRIILKWCKGDCLQPALHSLYSCFNRVPEYYLYYCYRTLAYDTSVSLKKHALFLAVLVFPIISVDYAGVTMMKAEKDVSVEKRLFSSCYKYFIKNANIQFLIIMHKYMFESQIVHDQGILDLIITNIHNIPSENDYKGKFANMVFLVLSNLQEKGLNVNKNYESFFQNIIDYDIRPLTDWLVYIPILKMKFFEQEFKGNPTCWKFAIQCMMYARNKKEVVQYVMQILHELKKRHWNSDEHGRVKSTIYHFCLAIFDKTMNEKDLRLAPPIEFVSIIREEWKAIFTQQETFEEYLLLEFMNLKYQDIELQEVAQKIWELLEDVRKSYGDSIISMFQKVLGNSIRQLLGNEKYEWKLMEILKYFAQQDNICPVHCILIINLLPRYKDAFKENHNFILSIIRSSQDPIVSMALNNYYKKSLCLSYDNFNFNYGCML